MPAKTPREEAREEFDRACDYIQRRLGDENEQVGRGYVARTAKAVGFSAAHISNAMHHGRIGEGLATAIAKMWGMTLDELKRVATGHDEAPALVAPEPTPHTPPVKSDTRLISSHWETPEVEGWFASAIRHAVHEPTGKQITVSKVFTREKMTRMVDGVDMVDFVLSVLEAARDLDERGQLGEAEDPATHTRIMAWLAAQSRARRTPRELAHAADRKARLLAEAQESPEDEPPSAEPVKTAPRKVKGSR